MNKSLFILLSSIFVSNIFAGNKDELHYETMRPAVFAAARLGQVGVTHNGKDFAVIKDGKAHPVKSYLVDKTLRGKSTQQVAKYLAHHSILVEQGSDQEFSLEAHNRQLGGGPYTGYLVYCATKAAIYGTALAGAGAAVAVTGGAAGAVAGTALGGLTGGAAGAVAGGVGTVLAAGGTAGAAVTTVGTAVVTGAGAVVTSGVGVGAAITAGMVATEAVSVAAGGFFTAIPWLP